MSDPNDLAAFLHLAWQHIQRGSADSRHPARYPTFGTVSPDGKPQLRTVALRRAQRSDGIVEVHTDIVTPKVTALRKNPHASLHIWVPRADLQIRMNARVEILTGPAVQAEWEKVPEASCISYGTLPDPGTPIDHVHAYEKPPNRNRFAVLRCHLTDLDLVQLGEKHRRALYKARDDWAGTWTAP